MADNQQVVRPVVQEAMEGMDVPVVVQPVVVVLPVTGELEHTELGVLLLPMEETEETTVLMRFVLEVLVAEVVPTVTPVAVAVAVATLVVQEDSTIHQPEAVVVEVPIITVPTKPMLVEYELDMDL
jgi:hypothetical protein